MATLRQNVAAPQFQFKQNVKTPIKKRLKRMETF